MIKKQLDFLKEYSPNFLYKLYVYCVGALIVFLTVCIMGLLYGLFLKDLFVNKNYQSTNPIKDSTEQATSSNQFDKSFLNPNTTMLVENDSNYLNIEYQKVKIDSIRKRMDLPLLNPTMKDLQTNWNLLVLMEIITKNLPALLSLIFAFYLLPVFSSAKDEWRLMLIISLATVLIGGLLVLLDQKADTSIDFFNLAHLSTSSVGIAFCFIGGIVAIYSTKKSKRK